jgi:signal transduction histidine kinase
MSESESPIPPRRRRGSILPWRADGLARRMLLSVVLFSSAVTAVITALDLYSLYRRDVRAIESAFAFVGDNYLPALVIGVWAFDDRQVRSQLDALVKLQDVRYVAVEVDGRTRWSSGSEIDGRTLERRLPLVLPSDVSGRPLGHLRIVASLDQVLDRVWARLFTELIANAVKTTLVAGFVLLVFHRLVTRHLARQAEYARSIRADGTAPDHSRLVLDRSERGLWRPDILDVLTDAINQMLGSLRAAQVRLADSQAAAAESARLLRTGLEATSAGVWEWRVADGRIRLDPMSCRLTGLPTRATVDHEFIEFEMARFEACFMPEDRARAVQVAQAGMAVGDAGFRVDMRVPDGAGRWRWVLWRGRVVQRGAGGEAVLAFGTLSDVHERRTAQADLAEINATLERRVAERTQALQLARDEAVQANRAKSDFLSRMSHELRTPLNAVLGFAQLLCMSGGGERERRWGEEIRRSGEHLLHLIEDLLDLARIEAGRVSIELRPVALAPLVDEVFSLVRAAYPHSKAELSWHTQVGHPQVMADALRLRQVLVNLVGNAVKYNRDDRRIEVFAEPAAGNSIRVGVADRGIGVPAEREGELFSPFARLGRERSTVQGAGIGLSVSRALVELMGGRLGFQRREGSGSVFWIELPASAAGTGTAGEMDIAIDADPPEGQLLLYVEDNAANRQLLIDYFSRSPTWRLAWTDTGREALEAARQLQPRVILLDIHLPDMNGYEVAAALRGDPATRDIPIVAVSADAMPADVERGRAAGFSSYLTKPIDLEGLRLTLGRIAS